MRSSKNKSERRLHILRRKFPERESRNVYNLISSNLNLPYLGNSLSLRFSFRGKLFHATFLAPRNSFLPPKSCHFFPSRFCDYLHNSILFTVKSRREKRRSTNAISRWWILSETKSINLPTGSIGRYKQSLRNCDCLTKSLISFALESQKWAPLGYLNRTNR